ncbi:MAG: hypothetical protein U0263_18245 [Polyangiaceae bacterium]
MKRLGTCLALSILIAVSPAWGALETDPPEPPTGEPPPVPEPAPTPPQPPPTSPEPPPAEPPATPSLAPALPSEPSSTPPSAAGPSPPALGVPLENARAGELGNEENRPKGKFLSLYGGLELTWWSIEWGDQSDSFRGILGGYDRETAPFVRYSLEARLELLKGLGLGLGYLTNRFEKIGDFGNDDDFTAESDPVSRTLIGVLSYAPPVDGLSFDVQATLRRFESSATATGRTSATGPALAQNYLPYQGDPVVVQPGQKVKWFSSTKEIRLRGLYEVMEMLEIYLGYRRMWLVTPTDVELTTSGGTNSFQTLMGGRTTCSGVELGAQWQPRRREEGLSFVYDAPVFFGSQTLETQYFTAEGGDCVGWGASVGVRYQTETFGFDFGGFFFQMSSATTPGGVSATTSKAFDVLDVLGDPVTLQKGTELNVDTSRFESFPGLYARAAYGF